MGKQVSEIETIRNAVNYYYRCLRLDEKFEKTEIEIHIPLWTKMVIRKRGDDLDVTTSMFNMPYFGAAASIYFIAAITIFMGIFVIQPKVVSLAETIFGLALIVVITRHSLLTLVVRNVATKVLRVATPTHR